MKLQAQTVRIPLDLRDSVEEIRLHLQQERTEEAVTTAEAIAWASS